MRLPDVHTARRLQTAIVARRTLASVVLLFLVIGTGFAGPDWVDSYGADTPYAEALFYTGFGLAPRSTGDSAALDAAKTQAKSDLISKIQVQVRSTITSRETSGGDSSTEATAVSESIATLDIEGVEYDVEKSLRNIYVLARVRKEQLASAYRAELASAMTRIDELYRAASGYESSGDQASALDAYAKLAPVLQEAFRTVGLLETIVRGSLEAEMPENERRTLSQLTAEVDGALDQLKYGVSRDLEAAMSLMLVQLADQGLSSGEFRVANLTYQDSDYSSAFGAWVADAIESALARQYRGSGAARVVRGTYWPEDREIVLRLLFQSPSGRIDASSVLKVPVDSVSESIEITPRNFEQALADQRVIASGAIVDGGISVEVWTNKGRNADRLVFAEGETLQFYFKVNQPSYLQLTYILATGERVLLDESFYIGQDRVNLVVRYPTEFEPVAPFGVERLVVTAYEDSPPRPDIVIRNIEGYDYEVFDSMDAVFSATRGLRPKAKQDPNRDARVGEASLAMTTVAQPE